MTLRPLRQQLPAVIAPSTRFEAHVSNAQDIARCALASAMCGEAADTAQRAKALFATATGLNPRDRAAPIAEAVKSARTALATLTEILREFDE